MRSFKFFHFDSSGLEGNLFCFFFEISRAVKPQRSRGRSVPGPHDYQGPLRLSGVSLLATFLFCCVSHSQKYHMLVEKCPFLLFWMRCTWKPKYCFFYCFKKKKVQANMYRLLLQLFYCLTFQTTPFRKWIPMFYRVCFEKLMII